MTSPFTQSPNVFKHETTHVIGARGYRQRAGQPRVPARQNMEVKRAEFVLTRQRCASDGLQALPRVLCTPSLLGVSIAVHQDVRWTQGVGALFYLHPQAYINVQSSELKTQIIVMCIKTELGTAKCVVPDRVHRQRTSP